MSTTNSHSDTSFVYMTFFYTEMSNDGHCYLRSRMEKISREEFEEKYAMRDEENRRKKQSKEKV